MTSILVPAFPAVLRVGLSVIELGRPVVVFAVSPRLVVAYLADGVMVTGEASSADLRLDLRDPTVWDASLRALERSLDAKNDHPTPAPMNCPAFMNGFLGFTLLVGDVSYGLNAMANKGAEIRSDVYDPDATDEDITLRGLACVLTAAFGGP